MMSPMSYFQNESASGERRFVFTKYVYTELCHATMPISNNSRVKHGRNHTFYTIQGLLQLKRNGTIWALQLSSRHSESHSNIELSRKHQSTSSNNPSCTSDIKKAITMLFLFFPAHESLFIMSFRAPRKSWAWIQWNNMLQTVWDPFLTPSGNKYRNIRKFNCLLSYRTRCPYNFKCTLLLLISRTRLIN